MATEEIKILLSQVMPTPNEYFWYILAGLFGGLLLWLLKRDMDKKDVLLEKLVESVNILTTTQALHQQKLDKLDEEVKEIKDKI